MRTTHFSLLLALVGAANAGLLSGASSGLMNSLESSAPSPPKEAFWTPDQVITNNGYTLQTHKITTQDGYILTAFRIPNGKTGSTFEGTRRPIFLNHGFVNSAWDWFAVSPERALPFLLSDAGYDVWVGSVRGTWYSQSHTDPALTIKNPKFWNFTLNEIGDIDVPAFIDYILEETSYAQLDFVGFSQGCTTLFQLLSTNTAYNQKVGKMVALAPPAYLNGTESVLYFGNALIPDEVVLAFWDTTLKGMFQLVPGQQYLGLPVFCSVGVVSEGCNVFLESIGGFNPSQANSTTTDIVSGHSPAPGSVRQYLHWRQFVKTGIFARYNYGTAEKNMAAYGTSTPPEFDLSKVTLPVWAKYGLGDKLVKPENAVRNIRELGNCVNKETAAVADPQKSWTHLDFLYGNDVRPYVYDDAIKWLLELGNSG